MKHLLSLSLSLLLVSLFSFSSSAQTSSSEAEVLKMYNETWAAYETKDMAKVWSMYSDKATEIYPDGSLISGLSNIKQAFEQFSSIVEGTPHWKVGTPAIRFITAEVALVTSDVMSDIKLKGGQQIGGKLTFALLLRKTHGKWLIEFDSQTPTLPVPGN